METTAWRARLGAAVIALALVCGLPAIATGRADAASGAVQAWTDANIALPAGLTTGPDGNVWFVSSLNGRLGRITPTGTIDTFADPAGEVVGPKDAVYNPTDGLIWFSSFNNSRIGTIVADAAHGAVGTIATFTDAAFSAPDNMALGADGNVWFTHGQGIARVTPGRVFTNFTNAAIPHGTSDLAPDSNGNMWFTSFTDNRVGRVSTTTGAVTTFPLPSTMEFPTGITEGPDGNMWVIGAQHNRIARVTSAGAVTVVPTTAFAGALPTGSIITGPDDNLWFFTEDNKIGRITPADVVTIFPTGGHISIGTSLLAGPDDNVWFGGGFANKIGYVEVGAAPVTHTLTVSVAGTGTGSVTGTGINCQSPAPGGPTCTRAYAHGDVATLLAANPANATFTGWSGACTGTQPTCQVSMNSDQTVTATFAPTAPQTRRLQVTVAGAGRVDGLGTGDGCVNVQARRTCTFDYPTGTTLHLASTSSVTSVFSGWGGACTGLGACDLTMTADRAVTARFALLQQLSIVVTGDGSVTGPSVPHVDDPISCSNLGGAPQICFYSVEPDRLITLTRHAAQGWRFAGWSGPCSGTASTCQVTMDASRTVRAVFEPKPPPTTQVTFNIQPALRKATFRPTGSGGVGARTFECRLDSPTWEPCTNPRVYTNLSRGQHTFRVRAVDSRGVPVGADPTPEKVSFTI